MDRSLRDDDLDIEEVGAPAAEELRRTGMLLLERQFIHDGDYGLSSIYRLAVEKHEHFSALFDGLGLDFLSRPEEGFVGVLPRGLTRRRMSIDESVFGVALRLAYEKGVEARNIGDRGRVSVLMSEVWELAETSRPGRQRPLGLGAAREIFGRFSSRGMVALLEELPDGDAAIEIRPCIRLAISDEVLRRMAADLGRLSDQEERAVTHDASPQDGAKHLSGS